MNKMIIVWMTALLLGACAGDGGNSEAIRQQAKEAVQAGTAAPAPAEEASPVMADNIQMTLPKGTMAAGTTQCFEVKVAAFKDILATQYTLNWDPKVLTFKEIKEFKLPFMTKENFGIALAPNGKLSSVWIENSLKGATIPDGGAIYQLCFEAAGKAGQSSELWVSGTPTAIEVVTKGDQVWGINAVKGKIAVE